MYHTSAPSSPILYMLYPISEALVQTYPLYWLHRSYTPHSLFLHFYTTHCWLAASEDTSRPHIKLTVLPTIKRYVVGFVMWSLQGCQDCALGQTELGVSWAVNGDHWGWAPNHTACNVAFQALGPMDQGCGNKTLKMRLVNRDDQAVGPANQMCFVVWVRLAEPDG
jgi:hypothetical protein